MLNEWIKKIDEIINRLNMFIQVSTQEVIRDLNKVKELLETPVVIEPVNEIQEIKQAEVSKVSTEETKEDIVKRYIDKFNKKPFAWWSKEVLKEKLGE